MKPLLFPIRSGRIVLATLICGSLLACNHQPARVLAPEPLSTGHISEAPRADTADASIPSTTGLTLAPPALQQQEDLFTIVVTDVPARKILFALARDAQINIDVHPTVEGNVTLNAIDQTLTQILDRLAKQIDIRYRVEDDLVSVVPDTPYLHSYTVDYLNMARISTSQVSIATEVRSTGSGAGDDGGAGEANVSNTNIENSSSNLFWDSLLDNIRAIVRGGDSDTSTENTDSGQSESANDGTSIIANRESGIITVRASRKQHIEVEKYINRVIESANRQVVIEATIAEVTLNDEYQAGVDWQKFGEAGDFVLNQNLTGANLAQPPVFSLDYTDATGGVVDMSTSVKLLNQFGNAKVLSSPKLMVLNNQTAILKVVENKIYFSTEADTDITDGVLQTTIETEIHTLPVGFVMSVTPQISKDDIVTINARPTISRITGFVADPNPELARVGVESLIPEIQVREVESILKIAHGDIGIIGGIMQDRVENDNDAVPGLGKIPGLGNLFKYRSKNREKTELIVFIRPYVIDKASLDGDLEQYREYLATDESHSHRKGDNQGI